jgi:muconate cycloisomerase
VLERTQSKSSGSAAHKPLPIRRIDAIPVALPLKSPMKMSGITIAKAENLLVRIEAANGSVGWGEAASAPTMTGDTLGGLVAAVRDHLAPPLIGQDAHHHSALATGLRRTLIGNPGAHSALEMALLDLTCRAGNRRLIDTVVTKPKRAAVRPMWLLGNATLDEDIAEAHAKLREGFHFFKLKIGVKPLANEIAATLAVREALGPRVPLCADANGGLTRATAKRYIERTRKAKLSFVEQPLPHDDLDGLKLLARMGLPLGVDEGIHSLADVTGNARAGAAGVSLKLIKLGGFAIAYDAAKLCRRLNLKVNVAAKIAESSLATAAAIHLACAVPNIDWGVSLTHFYLAEDIVRQPFTIQDRAVALPTGPGLGVEVDEAAVERLRIVL